MYRFAAAPCWRDDDVYRRQGFDHVVDRPRRWVVAERELVGRTRVAGHRLDPASGELDERGSGIVGDRLAEAPGAAVDRHFRPGDCHTAERENGRRIVEVGDRLDVRHVVLESLVERGDVAGERDRPRLVPLVGEMPEEIRDLHPSEAARRRQHGRARPDALADGGDGVGERRLEVVVRRGCENERVDVDGSLGIESG